MIKILVVDDETDVKALFEMRFRKEIRNGEMNFSFVYSGEEALVFLKGNPQKVVLILLDINMPGMSGLELLKHIKEDFPVAPRVIMITAYDDEENHRLAMKLGAEDLLTKPVNFSLLREKLSEKLV